MLDGARQSKGVTSQLREHAEWSSEVSAVDLLQCALVRTRKVSVRELIDKHGRDTIQASAAEARDGRQGRFDVPVLAWQNNCCSIHARVTHAYRTTFDQSTHLASAVTAHGERSATDLGKGKDAESTEHRWDLPMMRPKAWNNGTGIAILSVASTPICRPM
jgi:hypothetical protein